MRAFFFLRRDMANIDREIKQVKVDTVNLWQFNYKRGPAGFTGIVQASTEQIAYAVAKRWCELNNVRVLAGKVTPMILATESILSIEPEAPSPMLGEEQFAVTQ